MLSEKDKKRGEKCKQIAFELMESESPNLRKIVRLLEKAIEFLGKNEEIEKKLEEYKKLLEEEKNNPNIKEKEVFRFLVMPSEERKLKMDSEYSKYKDLEDFDYFFNEEQTLVKISEPNKRFQYIDQSHYDFLCYQVNDYVQEIMKKEVDRNGFGLIEKWLPEDLKEEDKYVKDTKERKQVNIFHSKNAFETEDEVLIFIQGSGIVRAGVWSTKLCINNNLKEGTIFEYLKLAKERKWEVIVLNPNRNYTRKTRTKIPENDTKWNHVINFYDKYLHNIKSKKLLIVAHSFGGCLTIEGLLRYRSSILKKLKAVAFTDSVHLHNEVKICSNKSQQFLLKNSRNWAKCLPNDVKPLDFDMGIVNGIPTVSAGTEHHILTSHFACYSVFRYLDIALLLDSKNTVELFNEVKLIKEKGNDFIKKKDIKNSYFCYQKAKNILSYISELEELEVDLDEIHKLELQINSNIGLVLMLKGLYEKAISIFTTILGIDKNNVKILKRRGKCYFQLKKYKNAKSDIKAALLLNKNDKEARLLFKKIKKQK